MTTSRGRWTAFIFCVLAAAGPAALPLRQAPRESQQALAGVISGVVVDAATGSPLPGAVVFIAATPTRPIAGQTRQLTDDRGRFAFTGLPGDVKYTLTASKSY